MILTSITMVADLKILGKYYDMARVIDPLAVETDQAVVVFSSPAGHLPQEHFGEQGQICQQCVCQQAVHTQETVVKVTTAYGKAFLITAMPVELDGRRVALELVKCVNGAELKNFAVRTEENEHLCRSVARLNDLAYLDALTNMYNRRYIDQQLMLELDQARQYNQPFSVIMIDIDEFKQINDQYGHSVGDEVLKRFAAQLQNNIRASSSDWGARYGGEEFLVVLPNCSEQPAYAISEKLRNMIAHTVFRTSAGDLRLTASFGVHTSCGQESELHQLIDKVDAHLYRAKQTGRNRTVTANAFSICRP